MPDTDTRWQAVLRKDKRQDGSFFFGVTTTGVYCRPSCPARRPLRQNVRFYETRGDAERDGLRPCRRCRPEAEVDPATEKLRQLCDFIRRNSDTGEALTLERLGREAGMSPFHLQRTFKAAVGLTPKQYLEACRLEALKQQLRTRGTVTDAIYEAGFGSGSRVYERGDSRLGMTPGEYRSGGRNLSISWAIMPTPLGLLMVAATDRGLCFVQFGDSEKDLLAQLQQEYPAATLQSTDRPWPQQFALWMSALSSYLGGENAALDLPVDVHATAFQFRVWHYLQSIPSGEVRSYSEVAAAMGQPAAVRAVANACASNRVALVVPCHRVIRSNGDLGGYRWGLERKRALLDQERGAGLHRAADL